MVYIPGLNTNRSFRAVDERFGLRLNDEIKTRAYINPPLVVLDVACGTRAEAITSLIQLYPSIQGMGLDYQLDSNKDTSDRLHLVRGDLFQIPFHSIADVAYCAYVLADIKSEGQVYAEKVADVVIQMAKTLKEGGIAFIDEGTHSSSHHLLGELVTEIHAKDPHFFENYNIANDPDIGLIGNFLKIQELN